MLSDRNVTNPRVLGTKWHFPCTPVMPLSELEDRRDGLQSYLSALSDLSESWNSPAVTDVLCEEVAVAATLVDDSDASEVRLLMEGTNHSERTFLRRLCFALNIRYPMESTGEFRRPEKE